MKIRTGFVSNSSSSSFIMGIRIKDEKQHLLDILRDSKLIPDRAVVKKICQTAYCNMPGVIDYIVDEAHEVKQYIKDNYDFDKKIHTVGEVYGSQLESAMEQNKDMIFYLVRASDESGGVGSELRSEIGCFDNLFSEDFVTFTVED